MPEPIIGDMELTGWDLRVFCALARLTRGKLAPKAIHVRTIAARFAVDFESGKVLVRRALRHLEQRGHIKVTRRNGATSTYDLTPAWAETENPQVLTTENPQVLTSAPTENPGVVASPTPPDPPVRPERTEETRATAERAAAAVGLLLAQGIGEEAAADLVKEFGPEAIELQLGYLPDRQAEVPAAVLVESIRGAWPPPRRRRRAVPEGPEGYGKGGLQDMPARDRSW